MTLDSQIDSQFDARVDSQLEARLDAQFASRFDARFVTTPGPVGAGDPAIYVRGEFHAPARPVRATLRVTGLGVVEPWLNGRAVGDHVLTPGWTSYRHRLHVVAHDVTAAVREGVNVLGAIVGEGWACGRLGWEGRRGHWAAKPAAWLHLDLDYGDHTQTLTSGPEFTCGVGAVRANSIYDGVTIDDRCEPDGWCEPGFAGFGPVQVLDWPREALLEQGAEPIRRVEELAPASITVSPSGRTIVDFGQNIAGWVRLEADGPAGTEITLRHAELLTGGELDVETLRTAEATDRWILAGGPARFEPRFTFHGFRYAEITGYPGDLHPEAIRAVVLHSDMRRTGWFECSDERINRLHANAVWSMRGNFVGLPTDCPQRDERLGWTGDINAFTPVAAFLYDVRGVLGSWLADLLAEQAETGSVPWVVPDMQGHPSSPAALWSDVVVSLPWALYRAYGEKQILRTALPGMLTYLRQVEPLLADGVWGAGFQFGDWVDPDAPPSDPSGGKTDRHLVATAYLARVIREAASAAEILGESDDAAWLRKLDAQVRAGFRREYVTPAGRISGETATGYALAIAFDLLEADQEARAGERLAAIVAKAGFHIATGFAGTPLLLGALARTGRLHEAFRLLEEDTCPSFLYPVAMGATTTWERWDAILPDGRLNSTGMTSLNHYALGAVVDWLHTGVGGLTPLTPGYGEVLVAPQVGGHLTWASVSHETAFGRIEVAWRISEGVMTVDVALPAGTRGMVVLPLDPAGRRIDVGPGEHSWSYDLPRGEASGLTMDSPIAAVAADPAVWERVQGVFARHIPGIPIDGNDPQAAAVSLNAMLTFIPGASQEFAEDLERALVE